MDQGQPISEELLAWLAEVRDDPLAFTLGAYPWGVPGTALEKFDGPMPWARELMERVRDKLITVEAAIAEARTTEPIQEATASGHGIAKSATVAQLILWAFITYPDCRGVITANTETQLKTKTWAELGKWFNLCWFARDHFILNATSLISRDPTRERTWRIDMIPWSEKNTEAFAGLHNQGKRLLLIFDEASAIPDIIWETAEGALTDDRTQIIWIVCGNPTRNSGRFKECFAGGKHAAFWHSTQIDSRTVPITNKVRFERWIAVYGEDSDFVRIRVKGQFPRHGEMEFFSAFEIDNAMAPDREVHTDRSTPLALGVDVARYGRNASVLFPRKGRDARTIPRRIYRGLGTVELANKVHDAYNEWHPDGIFIDGGGVGGGVVDNCRHQRLDVVEVQFGGKDIITSALPNSGEHYANMRAAIYGACRAWLPTGMLPFDADLRTAMLAIKYTFNNKNEIQLVSKEDLMDENPELVLDDLDALCLTFGGPLAANANAGGEHPQRELVQSEYDPYAPERMSA